MKMFNKVLAVVLSLMMLLSVVPAAAFAAEPGSPADVLSGSESNVNSQVTPAAPAIKGTGADGTITLKLSASALVDAIKGEKTMDALAALLREAIDRNPASVLSAGDLMGMIPADKIADAILGENNKNLPTILDAFGGIEGLMDMVDVDKVFATADSEALLDIVLNLKDTELYHIFYCDTIYHNLPADRKAEIDAELIANTAMRFYIELKLNEMYAEDPSSVLDMLVAGADLSSLGFDSLTDEGIEALLAVCIAEGYINGSSFNVKASDLQAMMAKVQNGELAVNDFISMQNIFSYFQSEDYVKLAKTLDKRVLVSELKDNAKELIDIALDIVTKQQIKDVAEVLIYHALEKIDLLSINGYDVAVEDPSNGWFSLNLENTIRAIASLIPRLTEIADDPEGKLLAFNTYLVYENTSGKICTKDINIEVAVDGGDYDLSKLRDLIRKLADYIAIYNDGNQLYIDLTMPGAVTRAYAAFLESDKGDSIKDEILVLADKTGAELVAALEKLTLNDLLTLLKKVDVEYVYNYITNISYVEKVLELIQDKLGLNYALEDIQDLNKILDEIADGAPNFTIQKICDKLTEIVKIDVMKYLKKATSFVESNNTIEYYMSKLEKAPYIGEYVAKFNDKDLNELLETYKDMDPIVAISNFVANRVDLDIQYVLQHNDANEIYQLVLDKAADYEFYYNKVKNYVLAALDPDYTANTTWGKLIQKLIPDRGLNKFLNNSISDYYKGDGKFAGSASSITLNPAAISEAALDFITKYVSISDSYMDIIKNFLPDTTEFTFGLNLSLTFKDLAGVTFKDANGNKLLTTFLPYGLNPADYYTTGKDFSFWINEKTGEAVTVLNGDVTLIPVNGLFSGAILDKIDEQGNWFLVSDSENFKVTVDLTNPQNNKIVGDLIDLLINEGESLTVTNSKGLSMKLGEKTLDQMIGLALDAEGRFVISYAPNANAEKDAWAFNGGAFNYVPNRIEEFDLVVPGVATMPTFEDDFTITVPFANAVEANANQQTAVYVLTNGVPEKIDSNVSGKNVVFNVAHFSDYIVVNEYLFDTVAKGGISVDMASAADGFVPAGAVVTVAPAVDVNYRGGKRIVSINNGALTLGGTVTMPAAPLTLECVVENFTGTVYYNVFGSIFTDVAEATTALNAAAAPNGYKFVLDNANNRTWTDTQNGTDIYKIPAVKAIAITVIYGTAQDEVTYTLDTFSVKEVPLNDETKGYKNVWKLYTDAAFTNAAADLSEALFTEANDGATFYAKLEQTAETYTVYDVNGNKVADAAYKTSYTYNETKNGYTLKATYINMKDGSVINATNGAITMPASDVMVVATYEANDITYTVNGENRTGKYGDTISVTIPVANGNALTVAPEGGKLSSYDKETNTYVYTFELLSALAINYTVEAIDTDLGLTAPEKDAINRTGMIVALIILAVLAVLIAAIAILYNLYINEKLKPNAFLRFITWIVSMFFNLCLALSSLVLVVAQGTAKKGEVDYEEFGMSNPEDLENAESTETAENAEVSEETAEEAVEETEATEETEAAEETAVAEDAEAIEEPAVEETTEETTEEATEEAAAEEVTEVVEETTAEPVAEETSEEVASEEATVEEATVEEATVEETAAEEIATEEAAEEAVEAEDESEKQD